MGVASAVQWWEDSQLRVLVLGSLIVQYILLVTSKIRKYPVTFWWVRPVTWLAYIGSDAIAIYGLATLFNHYKKREGGHGYSAVEVLWAPVLLIHLGGQDGITAYNIEDNELWTRHFLTAVSQITVAVYVFWKLWPRSDRRLLQAAILLFISGILKCIEKPWALYSASINSLVSSENSVRRTTKKDGNIDLLKDFVRSAARCCAAESGVKAIDEDLELQFKAAEKDRYELQFKAAEKDKYELQFKAAEKDRYELQFKGECHNDKFASLVEGTVRDVNKYKYLQVDPDKLFVDLAYPSSENRLKELQYFSALDVNQAYLKLQEGLHHTFDLLYTKHKIFAQFFSEGHGKFAGPLHVIKQLFAMMVRGVGIYFVLAAIPLFHHSDRTAYNDHDVKVTYVMICATAGLHMLGVQRLDVKLKRALRLREEERQRRSIIGEMQAESKPGLPILSRVIRTIRQLTKEARQRRSTAGEKQPERKPNLVCEEQLDDMVFQYNLLGLFARNQKYPIMMSIVGAIGCKNILQQRWCMKSRRSSRRITALVLEYVKCGWKEGHMPDVPSYKKFNDNRGQFTLRNQGCYDKLCWTLQGSFDESVLLWHLATDFCYHYTGPSRHGSRCTKGHAYGYRCPAWCEVSVHHDTAVLCTHMSNYMVYLLFVKPDMLMAGTRRDIFTRAYKGLEEIMGKPKKPMLKERELVQRIVIKLDGRGTASPEDIGEAFVHDAWDIAKVLMALSDEAMMWKVIQGVWVEMLCFSATRCRGYLHAKSLGTGVEYLSYVWHLMYYMGMETLADRLQRVDDHGGGKPTRSDYCCGEHQAARGENSTDTGEDITIAG